MYVMLKSIKQVSQVPPIQHIGSDGKLYTKQLEFYLIRKKDRSHIPFKLREQHIIGPTGGNRLYLITKDLYNMIIAEGGGTEPIVPQDIYGIQF